MMPKSLLGRSLLMILIPLVAVQAVTFQMFYGSHVDIISRRLTTAIRVEERLVDHCIAIKEVEYYRFEFDVR